MKATMEIKTMSELTGGDGKKWPETMDAVVWAKEFVEMVKSKPSIATDEGVMISWFANAIMIGWDEHGRRTRN